MTKSERDSNIGCRVFGLAALVFGLITLAWHDYNGWHLPRYVAFAAGAAEIVGGAAMQFRPARKWGAAALGAVFLAFAFGCVRGIVTAPQVYNSWGNFFEQIALAAGGIIAYARTSSAWPWEITGRTGRVLVGICTASFALEQAFYLGPTAQLVPKWLPPSQMFWAEATTIFFGLAALALLANRAALLAARLLMLMLVVFGLVVWIPLLLSSPHSHTNWSETAETFAIAGTVWILADLLEERRPSEPVG